METAKQQMDVMSFSLLSPEMEDLVLDPIL